MNTNITPQAALGSASPAPESDSAPIWVAPLSCLTETDIQSTRPNYAPGTDGGGSNITAS